MHSAANSFSREISRHFDSYFEEFDLATSYVELFLIVLEKEEVMQNDVAEEMNLAPSTITRFVNKLVQKGILKKEKSGRTAVIKISIEGEKLAPKLKSSYERALQDLEDVLSDKYVHTTEGLLLHGVNILKEKE